MPRVDIVKRNGKVEFQPATLPVSEGDTVFWANHDPDAQHWIGPIDGSRTTWFTSPLAPALPGRPADVTDGLLVDPGDRIRYKCHLHPDEEGDIEIG